MIWCGAKLIDDQLAQEKAYQKMYLESVKSLSIIFVIQGKNRYKLVFIKEKRKRVYILDYQLSMSFSWGGQGIKGTYVHKMTYYIRVLTRELAKRSNLGANWSSNQFESKRPIWVKTTVFKQRVATGYIQKPATGYIQRSQLVTNEGRDRLHTKGRN